MLHSFLVQPLNRRFSRIHWLFSEWHDDDVVIMKHFIQPVLLPHAGDGATTINRRSPTLTFHKCHNIPIHSCNFATIQRYTLNAFSVVTYNRIIELYMFFTHPVWCVELGKRSLSCSLSMYIIV